MFGILKRGLGLGGETDFSGLVQQGALILDVRSAEEYREGHIDGSVNIPVQALPTRLASIPKDKTIITCCASGARSATAQRILAAAGFGEVHNGGGWRSLQGRLR